MFGLLGTRGAHHQGLQRLNRFDMICDLKSRSGVKPLQSMGLASIRFTRTRRIWRH